MIELLGSLAANGFLGALVAYLLLRMREMEAQHREDWAGRDTIIARAIADNTKAIQENTKANAEIAGWLRGRLQ